MILGIGIDIVENNRIKKSLKKYGHIFLKKFMNKQEIEFIEQNINYQHIAGIFAAKEAVIKAMTCVYSQSLHYLDFSIIKGEKGFPIVASEIKKININLKKINISISISHEEKHSVAMAICEEKIKKL